MSELAKMTWREARELFHSDVIAILPIGSTEPHGPHLPLDTDVTIAAAQADRAARRLAELGVRSFVLPPVNYGLTHWAQGFAGRISLRPSTLWDLLEDVVQSLERDGVERLVFSNGHLEPAHVKILRGVAADHAARSKGKLQVVFPDNTRRRIAETLGEEFKSGECHAGRYETSIVMAADPTHVREEARRELPSVTIHLLEKIQAGATSFQGAGASECYCGDPAAATVGEGHDLVERLADSIVCAIREAWPELFQAARP